MGVPWLSFCFKRPKETNSLFIGFECSVGAVDQISMLRMYSLIINNIIVSKKTIRFPAQTISIKQRLVLILIEEREREKMCIYVISETRLKITSFQPLKAEALIFRYEKKRI